MCLCVGKSGRLGGWKGGGAGVGGRERGLCVCLEGGGNSFFIVGYLLNRCLGENSSLNTV